MKYSILHYIAPSLLFFALPAQAKVITVTVASLPVDRPFEAAGEVGFDFGTAARGGDPYFISFAVPPGTYRLDLEFGGDVATETTVKSESRQLLVEALPVPAGDSRNVTTFVNVRTPTLATPPKNSPGGAEVRLNPREDRFLRWDDKLTLEVGGKAPGLKALTLSPGPVPVIYLLGDSTVTDQDAEPGASWGQMLPRFLHGVAVANHAESGETMKSFSTKLRLAKVLEEVKPGDYALLQFGHNDQKSQWPQTYVEAGTTYKAWLRVFIEELQLRKVTPILCTSVERRHFDEHGKIKPSHGAYPLAVREVAQEYKLLLIDLNEETRRFYEALGPALSVAAFSSPEDKTHHNNYGAYQIARMVAHALRQSSTPLAGHVKDAAPFAVTEPPLPADFEFAASPRRTTEVQRGN